MYRHEFQGKVELDMEIWVLAIDKGSPGGSVVKNLPAMHKMWV